MAQHAPTTASGYDRNADPGHVPLRVGVATADDLAWLRDRHGLSRAGAIAEGLTLLLGMFVELGSLGYVRLTPARGTRTLAASPNPTWCDTDPGDPVDDVDLPRADRSVVAYLSRRLDATEQDVIRHAIHVAVVLRGHADDRGTVERVAHVVR